jgi:endoribonuclease Dicer
VSVLILCSWIYFAVFKILKLSFLLAVCSAALAYIAVKHLAVHKVMLVNNVELNMAIDQYVPHFEQASAGDIVERGWKYDPPKALSDVFEGIIGALLIDSGYDYERTACVVEGIMEDVLSVLSPSVPLDPISALTQWLQASGCRERFAFRCDLIQRWYNLNC